MNALRLLHPAVALMVFVLCCGLPDGRAASAMRLHSDWTGKPLKLNGRFDKKWIHNYNALRLPHGWLSAQNDRHTLYLLVDLTGDTTADKRRNQPPWGDGLSISFDVDGNRKITPQTDVYFGLLRGKYQVGRRVFMAPGRLSGFHQSNAEVYTSFGGSPTLARNHRIWEVAIPLKEISTAAGKPITFGIQTRSVTPRFNDDLPSNHANDFKNLIELQLSEIPMRVAVAKPNLKSLRRFILKQPQQIVVRPVLEPSAGGLSTGTQPPCNRPEGKPVRRVILPDGTVELQYADGSKKQHKNGHWKFFCPDGTPINTHVIKSHIMPTFPPTLPDQEILDWLEYHNERLLGIIGTIVNDDKMIENYLNAEPDDLTIYQHVRTRSDTINYLLVE